jgi:predicted nucleic acid-binding protein
VLVALDTNVLVYGEGVAPVAGDAEKPQRVRELLGALPEESVVLPVQVLGELYRVLVGKALWAPSDARAAILIWRDLYLPLDTSAAALVAAVDLAADHRLSIWDAVVLAVAAEAGCRAVLSEDMQQGFTWRGLTVVDPFSPTPHPLLSALLAAG